MCLRFKMEKFAHHRHMFITDRAIIWFPIIAELWRAKRARGAPWVSKSTHARKFGNHVTVHRPPARCPSVRIPMFTLTFSSYLGSPGES